MAEGRKPDRLLQRGRPLGEAEELLAKRHEFVDKDLRAYIAAFRSRARQATRLRNYITVGAVALAIIALGAAILSTYFWYDASEQRVAAV